MCKKDQQRRMTCWPKIAGILLFIVVLQDSTSTRADEGGERTIDLPVSIEPYEQAHLMSKIDAYVKTVNVDIGDEVAEGEILIELDAPELEHEVERQAKLLVQGEAAQRLAEAELRAAEARLDEQQAMLDLRSSERTRIERLTSRGALTEQKRDEADFALKSAEATRARFANAVAVAEAQVNMAKARGGVGMADYAKAEAMARYRTLRAPFAGVVTRRDVDPGAFVRPAMGPGGEPLLTVANINKLRAVVYATMDAAAQLRVGDKVEITTTDNPGQVISARVSRTSGVFDEATRMMRAEIDIGNEPDWQTGRRPFRAGGYGTARITVTSLNSPAVTRPSERVN